jgi:hypothetical protein
VQRTPGFTDFQQSGFSATQFIRKFITSMITAKFCIFRVVGGLRLSEQFINFCLQTFLFGQHPVVAHGFMARCVGLDLCAIERQSTDLQKPGFPTQSEDFHKQVLKLRKMPTTIFTDRAKVRNVVPHDDSEGHVRFASRHDLPR